MLLFVSLCNSKLCVSTSDDCNLCNTAKALKTLPIQSTFCPANTLPSQHSNVLNDRHFTCEDCDGTVSGGFDAASSQVRNQLLSQDEQLLVASNPLINQQLLVFLDRLVPEQHSPAVPHGPSGHAWAHSCLWPLSGPCRLVQQLQTPCLFRSESPGSALTEWHFFLLCTEHNRFFFPFQIRAANLSGDCTFSNEVARFNFGLKQHHQVRVQSHLPQICFVFFSSDRVLPGQACVRGRALRSILAVRTISREEAEKIVDEVFDTCFNDHAPFGRIPHSKRDAQFAHKEYENRNRYYANL